MLSNAQRLQICSTVSASKQHFPSRSPSKAVSSPSAVQQPHLVPFRVGRNANLSIMPRQRCLVVQAAAAAEDAGGPRIRIKLKSYWKGMLTSAVEHIKEAATSTNAKFSGPVYLPTRRKIFTVLTSPHVNKDAREQFEIRIHSRLIDIKDLTPETIDRLMFLELPSGVNVQVKL